MSNAGSLVAEAVWKAIESTRSVTDDQLSVLQFLFGKNLERATRIVDQSGVKRVLGEPSGRSIFQVVGESRRKEEYFCFAEQYCACYSFFYDTKNKGEQLCCTHQLAARLAASLGACIEVKVSDEQLALLLSKTPKCLYMFYMATCLTPQACISSGFIFLLKQVEPFIKTSRTGTRFEFNKEALNYIYIRLIVGIVSSGFIFY
ncbi:hypothetical protein ACFX13_035626 [Malus domestica]